MGERSALDRQVVDNAERKHLVRATEHTWVGDRCEFCGATKRTRSGTGLETHAYAFIHTDDIKARMAELFGET